MRSPVRSRARRAVTLSFVFSTLLMPASTVFGRTVGVAPADAFHFYPPLTASRAGNPAQFDPTLLDYLMVDLCAVSGSSCLLVKRFTSHGVGSDAIRIESTPRDGSYYIVNWDSRTINLGSRTIRITVSIAGLRLGSMDVAPPLYNTFPRTWPIKFLIESNPTIRVRALRSIGQSAGQIAWALRREFNLSADDAAALLGADLDPFTETQIDVSLKGVYQEGVIVPDTTKITDPSTRAALTSFDPVNGTMVFSVVTDLLERLRTDDVLVSEPSAVAPYGYLRKVTAIQKKSGQITIQTVQASINEAVQKGTFDAAGELTPADLVAVQAAPGVTISTADPLSPRLAAGIGDGFSFSTDIDVTLDSSISGDGFNGSGRVRIQGTVRFNAGYSMGFGVEPCVGLPPVCVDRVEAHLGLDQYSRMHVTGNLDGTLDKETVLATQYFKPVVFFIGPVPVVLVPVVNAVAGVHGKTNIAFGFAGEGATKLKLDARWTDPGDGGVGWENRSEADPLKGFDLGADLSGNLLVRGYGKADAKLLLYGVAGPGFDGRVGVRADARFPRDPVWVLYADADGFLNFQVDIAGVLKLQEYRILALPRIELQLAAATNQAPQCTFRRDTIPANPTVPITLGPNGGGFEGFFHCTDPEGQNVSYSATSSNSTDGPNKDGVLPFENGLLRPTFLTAGLRRINITATDPGNSSWSFTLAVNVVNTPPVVTIATASTTVAATVQYFITASAYDWEANQFLPCSQIAWSVSSPDVLTVRNDNRTCTAVVVFPQAGTRQIMVRATDSLGASTDRTVTVAVTSPPSNPAPVIDLNSFSVVGTDGPDCFTDGFLVWHCQVPYGALLYNGADAAPDTYYPPLTLKLTATDPDGTVPTVQWFCQAGSNAFSVINNEDGTSTCNPGITTTPIAVWAVVSDGQTQVYSEVRHFRMLDVVR